jgi:hypothetical protein
MKALHEGFQRDLTREDTVFVSCPKLNLDTPEIFVRGKDPPDDSLSVSIQQRFGIDLKALKDGSRNELEVSSISLFFGKSV